jgi:hypothetical protein
MTAMAIMRYYLRRLEDLRKLLNLPSHSPRPLDPALPLLVLPLQYTQLVVLHSIWLGTRLSIG